MRRFNLILMTGSLLSGCATYPTVDRTLEEDPRPLPPGAILRLGKRYWQHRGTVSCIEVSPDGTLVASGDWNGVIRLWDASNLKPRFLLEHGDRMLECLTFSPDGHHLASADGKGHIRLWDLFRRTVGRALEENPGTIRSIAFSPDGRQLAAGGENEKDQEKGFIRLWDVETGKILWETNAESKPILSIAYDRNGRWIATGGKSPWIQLLDAGNGTLLHQAHVYGDDTVGSLALSPDGRSLASNGNDSRVTLWNVRESPESGTVLQDPRTFEGKKSRIGMLRYAPDGKSLAVKDDGGIAIRDAVTGEIIRRIEGKPESIGCFTYDRDGHRLFGGDFDGSIHAWDAGSAAEVHLRKGLPYGTRHVVWTADGARIVTAAGKGPISVWDFPSGRKRHELGDDTDIFNAIAVSPDSLLLSGSSLSAPVVGPRTHVRLWNLSDGRELAQRTGVSIDALAFDPSGTTLVGGGDFEIRLWRVQPEIPGSSLEKRIQLIEAGQLRSIMIATSIGVVSKGFRYVVGGASSGSGMGHGWAASVRDSPFPATIELARIQGHAGRVAGASISPDGTLIALAATHCCGVLLGPGASVWRLRLSGEIRDGLSPEVPSMDENSKLDEPFTETVSGVELEKCYTREGEHQAVAFTPDGGRVAFLGGDGLRLMDVPSWKELGAIRVEGEWIEGFAFSPNGRQVATGLSDGTTLVWDLEKAVTDK